MNSQTRAHPQITPVNFKYTPEIMDKYLISPSKEVYRTIYEGSFATLEDPSVIKIKGFVLISKSNIESKILFTSGTLEIEGWLGIDNYKRQEHLNSFLNIDSDLAEAYQDSQQLEFEDATVYSDENSYLKLNELMTEMEKYHVGKPSTYADIFKNLEKNIEEGYVEKRLIKEFSNSNETIAYEITEKGENFIEKYSQINDPFLDLKTSFDFEEDLQKITEEKLTRADFEEKYFKMFPEQLLEKINLKWIDDCF